MGVAAYNRGSERIRKGLKADLDVRPVEFELMERFNNYPKLAGAVKPFTGGIVIEFNGAFWIEGYDGYGLAYRTMKILMESWDITLVSFDGASWAFEIGAAQ